MKIQINTDANIQSSQALTDMVQDAIDHALSRFAEHITRIEVHLSDENAGKSGQHEQRCMMEARLESRQPVAVTEQAPVMAQAVQGAAQKLAHLLSSALGRPSSTANPDFSRFRLTGFNKIKHLQLMF